MPERQAFIDQVKSSERESLVIQAAINHYAPAVRAREVALPARTSPRDLAVATTRVEATYLIRMWAAFETALRSYCLAQGGNDTMKAVDLINWTAGIKQGRSISEDVRDVVHEVREYRNHLVHGNAAPAVSIEDARKRLNTLLHCLPHHW